MRVTTKVISLIEWVLSAMGRDSGETALKKLMRLILCLLEAGRL